MAGVLLLLSSRNCLVLGSNIDGWEWPTDMVESLVGASYCRVCLIELQGCLTVECKVVGIGDDLVVLLLLTVWGCERKVVGQQGGTKLHYISVEGLCTIGKNIDAISQCYRDNWYGGSTRTTKDRTEYEDTCRVLGFLQCFQELAQVFLCGRSGIGIAGNISGSFHNSVIHQERTEVSLGTITMV